MPSWLRRAAVPALLLLAALPVAAEHPVAAAQARLQEAAAAYREGDYGAFTVALERAHELNPASLATVYNLACGYAKTGRPDRALDLLEQLAAAGVDFGMADDPDLLTLRDRPRFRAALDRLAETTAPLVRGEEWLSVNRLGLVPEGIAADTPGGRVFFGSMRTGEIFVTDGSGGWSRFASVADEAPLAAVGMTVDRPRNLLWVVGSWFEMAEGYDPESPQRSGIFGFDLDSAELRHRYLAGPEVTDLNDVTLAPDGSLYVSGDPLQVLRAGAEELDSLAPDPAIFGGNGLALHPDGRTLFVASYPVGIAAVDLASGRSRILEAPATHPLYGIDGLYWHDGALLGVQNGVRPWRLLRIKPAADAADPVSVETLERANPALVPTTGALDGGRLLIVGQAAPPTEIPAHFPAALGPFSGRTVIISTGLPDRD